MSPSLLPLLVPLLLGLHPEFPVPQAEGDFPPRTGALEARVPSRTVGPKPPAIQVVGGARMGSGGTHIYGGVEGGWVGRRLGVRGVGHVGTGDGYGSVLAGGGPALHHPVGSRMAVLLWAGGGGYRESLPGGFARSLPVAMGGSSLHIPAGPLHLSLGVTALAGRHSSVAAPVTHGIRSLRITLGVGR